MGWLVTQSQTFWSAKSNGPLRSTAACKASGCNESPAELYKSLKKDAIKVLHSLWQQIWKTQQWPQDWKRSILIPIPKKGSTKECANHQTIALISQASKFNSVQFSHSVVSNSFWPHWLQHARPPCPSPTPGVYSNSCPLNQWCHPTILSSVVTFSSHF